MESQVGTALGLALLLAAWAVFAVAAAATGYLLVLAVVGLVLRALPRIERAAAEPSCRFTVLIPAHNEEKSIRDTVQSCSGLDYPRHLLKIVVVADNCQDETARVAREGGAVCWERTDDQRRGKGHALAWGIERVLAEGCDAVVVLDADCVIDRDALSVFDRYLTGGARVIQAACVALNPDESAISYAIAIGNALENDLFLYPKSRLGLAVFLGGTGMVLDCRLLEARPWRAHSIAEDVEYGLGLLQDGVCVHFVREAGIRTIVPSRPEQLRVQRDRWAAGNLSFGKTHAIRLVADGLRHRDRAMIDAGWTLFVQSRPLVLAVLVAATALAVASRWAAGPESTLVLVAVAVLWALQALIVLAGILLLGLSLRRCFLLLGLPAVIAGLVGISLRGMLKSPAGSWVRTPR